MEVSWGGLTVHHINDLGFDATDKARMPEFKGQFLGAVRGRPIRKPLGVPTKLSPAPTALCEKLRWGVEGARCWGCSWEARGGSEPPCL